jgi:hypothetical protein
MSLLAQTEHHERLLGHQQSYLTHTAPAFSIKGDIMAQPSESNSLELRIAFHNAVSRFQDWTTGVAEPKVRLCGRFWPISEVCQEIADLSDSVPKSILSVLYKHTKALHDVPALKTDETYRGAGQHLLRLIERRREEIRRRNALKS